MRLKRLILALVALSAVSGCAVGPDYEVPAVVTASAFKGAPVNSAPVSYTHLRAHETTE